jgi:hypothetical protein
LNRDLSKVIYIDWEPAAFQLNPENVLHVPKWEGAMDDTYLVDLAELLKSDWRALLLNFMSFFTLFFSHPFVRC